MPQQSRNENILITLQDVPRQEEVPSEMNTNILFQDHQTNNFYYHDRLFTHKNINKYYVNGAISYVEGNMIGSIDKKEGEIDFMSRVVTNNQSTIGRTT